jgi:hypothetical protein
LHSVQWGGQLAEEPNVNISDSVVMGDVLQYNANTCPACDASNVRIMMCQEEGCEIQFCELCHAWCRCYQGEPTHFSSATHSTPGPFCPDHLAKKIIDAHNPTPQPPLESREFEFDDIPESGTIDGLDITDFRNQLIEEGPSSELLYDDKCSSAAKFSYPSPWRELMGYDGIDSRDNSDFICEILEFTEIGAIVKQVRTFEFGMAPLGVYKPRLIRWDSLLFTSSNGRQNATLEVLCGIEELENEYEIPIKHDRGCREHFNYASYDEICTVKELFAVVGYILEPKILSSSENWWMFGGPTIHSPDDRSIEILYSAEWRESTEVRRKMRGMRILINIAPEEDSKPTVWQRIKQLFAMHPNKGDKEAFVNRMQSCSFVFKAEIEFEPWDFVKAHNQKNYGKIESLLKENWNLVLEYFE